MSSRPGSLPSDPAELARMVLALQAENADLRVYADLLRLMIFGAKSEKMTALDPAQIALDLGDLSDSATTAPEPADDDAPGREGPPRRKRSGASRNMGALPRHLPRHEEVIEPRSTICPCCDLALHRIGEDVSEALDIVPARSSLQTVHRTVCSLAGTFFTA